ncbi:hypothetical protein ABZ479_22240 [Streptomyces sp. NPDC005722]
MGFFGNKDRRKGEQEAIDHLVERVLTLLRRPPAERDAGLRDCLATAEVRFGDEHLVTDYVLYALCVHLESEGQWPEAETRVLRLRTRHDTLEIWILHVRILSQQGRHEEAARELDELIEAASTSLDEFGAQVLLCRAVRGNERFWLGRVEESEQELRSVLERSRLLPPPAGFAARWLATDLLSHLLTSTGRPEEGLAIAEEALGMVTRYDEGELRLRFGLELCCAHALNRLGSHAQALESARSAFAVIAGAARSATPPSVVTLQSAEALSGIHAAEALLGLGRREEAAREGGSSIATLRRMHGPHFGIVRQAERSLADLLDLTAGDADAVTA